MAPNQVMSLDRNMYDGNPPYTVAEQQDVLSIFRGCLKENTVPSGINQ